ncbi:hypothetical protein FHS15_003856 [Paenibacillus castaneae]|uniref:acyltransferase domain-containing protein n=1 Tax=Paenibacillus castaneae TaxID=474957 RepID=UPI000C9CB0DB|nr:acyltransferase domain-containing protein [Paenibacillus castaneae]NIK78710.1 hypothetical protein [Paenibacillus castaneae]
MSIERQLYFLTDEYIAGANQYFKLSEEKLSALNNALEMIRESEELTSLAIFWKSLIYEHNNLDEYNVGNCPAPEREMGPAAGMFPLIVAISNLPWLIEYYTMHQLSEVVLYDTLSDIGIVMEESRNRTGNWGIEAFLLDWLINHFQGRLFRIGRLQYIPIKNNVPVRVYRHCNSGKVVAINGDGYPITPYGTALSRPVRLCVDEWELMLDEGDWLLDVHIPRGEKLDYELLEESYQRAIEQFSRLLPEHSFKGFICDTWMFDPQLQEILPKTSNLVKFQADYYLYQVVDSDSIYETVFVKKPKDLHTLPEATTLQRAVKRHILSGKSMRSAAGFLLIDDLRRGPAYYQKKQGAIQLT